MAFIKFLKKIKLNMIIFVIIFAICSFATVGLLSNLFFYENGGFNTEKVITSEEVKMLIENPSDLIVL